MAVKTLQPVAAVVATAAGLTTATTAYTSGDMLGTEITLTGMTATAGDGGVITGITLENSANTVALGATEMWLFNVASGAAADNAANAWSDTQLRTCVLAAIPLAAPVTVAATGQMISQNNLWIPYHTAGTTSLFLNVVTRSGHTFFTAATDLQYTFEILQWT